MGAQQSHAAAAATGAPPAAPAASGCPISGVKTESGGCPMGHGRKPAAAAADATAAASPAAAAAPAAVCPVRHSPSSAANSAGSGASACPVRRDLSPVGGGTGSHNFEPANSPDRVHPFLKGTKGAAAAAAAAGGAGAGAGGYGADSASSSSSSSAAVSYDKSKIEEHDTIMGASIPSTGRGNNDDGSAWVNPSPGQLFRALRRKNKHIEEEDALAVAFVHSVVVEETWKQIMEFEQLHFNQCKDPTLARFEGKFGIPSWKTRLMTFFGGQKMEPFDRHDWTVDRCGKEVTYIIDYYASENKGEQEYYIDCRPAPTPGGLADRAQVAFKRWKKGEPIW